MRKWFYLAAGLFVIGLIGSMITIKSTDVLHFHTIHLEKKPVAMKDIRNITVETPSTDVQIVPTAGKQLTAELKGRVNKDWKDNFSFHVSKQGTTVHIQEKEKNQFFVADFGWMTLVIHVPRQQYDTIRVHTSSGAIKASGLQAGKLSLISSSGDISSNSGRAADAYIVQSSSGEIGLNGNISKKDIAVRSSSGDIHLKKLAAAAARVRTSSGEISATDVEGAIDTQSSSGDIGINIRRMSGNISALTSSGAVAINLNEDPAAVAVDYRGNSGEGTVKLKDMLYKEKSEHRIVGQKGSGGYRIKGRTSSGDFLLK